MWEGQGLRNVNVKQIDKDIVNNYYIATKS